MVAEVNQGIIKRKFIYLGVNMVSANEYIQKLGIGIDVDWMKTTDGRRCFKASIDKGFSVAKQFRAKGFNHVRIRVMEYDLSLILNEIETAIDDCLDNQLIPVLAFQAQKFKSSPNEETLEEVIAWWAKVAERFKDKDLSLSFNLIIETTEEVRNNPAILNDLYARCVKRIAPFNVERVLIMPPAGISAPERLKDLLLPTGCVAESHFYAAGMSRTKASNKWTTGTASERQLILDKIKLITDWRDATGNEVWVGAIMFGDFNKDGDDDILTCSYTPEEQAFFASFVCSELKKAKIPFAINSDTKFHDRETNEWLKIHEIVLDTVFSS